MYHIFQFLHSIHLLFHKVLEALEIGDWIQTASTAENSITYIWHFKQLGVFALSTIHCKRNFSAKSDEHHKTMTININSEKSDWQYSFSHFTSPPIPHQCGSIWPDLHYQEENPFWGVGLMFNQNLFIIP